MNSERANRSKANILVVDDTPDNLRLLSALLTKEGYTVRKVLTGEMALTACNTLPPDLILLDINMPEMNGYEVCKQLKINERTCEIPVIFISALDEVLDKAKAFEVGGVDYITKPFQGGEVFLRIENQLKLRSLQLTLQKQNGLLEQTLDELKNAQVQMLQNEKMVALGQLVAGIAHEINNPVSFIYSNLIPASNYVRDLVSAIEVYQEEYPNPTPRVRKINEDLDLNFVLNDVQSLMKSMHTGAERIRQIVVSLRNFSRLDESQMKPIDVHEGLDSTLVMLQHRISGTDIHPPIQVIKEYGNLPLVTCYASQINQVFMHLLNNAIDALEENGAGDTGNGKQKNPPPIDWEPCSLPIADCPTIRIRTERTDSDTVKIWIADNGPGIEESARSRLFDPFFTTKPVGKGTGLGLSISYQIVVQKHHGQLVCCSSPGYGAEFAIEIPVHQP